MVLSEAMSSFYKCSISSENTFSRISSKSGKSEEVKDDLSDEDFSDESFERQDEEKEIVMSEEAKDY